MKQLRRVLAPVYLGLSWLWLLWQPLRLMNVSLPAVLTDQFDVIWVGMAAVAFVVWRLWTKRPCRLMVWAYLWIICSLLLCRREELLAPGTFKGFLLASLSTLQYSRAILGPMAYALFTCFYLGYIAEERQLQIFLRATCAWWSLWVGLLSLAGLVTSLSGTIINMGDHILGIDTVHQRLFLLSNPTDSGGTIATGICVAALGICLTKAKPARVLYGLSIAVQALSLPLTDCRGAFISLGFGLGLMAVLLLTRERPAKKLAPRMGMLAVGGLAGAVACFLMMAGLVRLFSPLLTAPGQESVTLLSLLPTAKAEGAVRYRSVLGKSPFTGRENAWLGVINLLRDQPIRLLTGTSILDWYQSMSTYTPNGRSYSHAHNILLQILMELGIPGLVLALAALGCVMAAGVRLMTESNRPLWQRLCVLPVFVVLLGEMAECNTMPGLLRPHVPLAYIGMGIVCALGEKRPRTERGLK